MTDIPMAQDADDASATSFEGPHYLRAVTSMAEKCKVVAHKPIYTNKGIKLVDQGARIDTRLVDRLLRYTLRDSLDSHLSVEHAVDMPALEALAYTQCISGPLAIRLVQDLQARPDGDDGIQQLLAPLRLMPLPQPLAFRLTVIREQRPDLLDHSINVMLVAVYLGLRSGWSERECALLAAAGLFHDLGEIHMDPIWRDPQFKATGQGRKHLVAHPVTAMLIVRGLQMFPRTVEAAVLEHHERMDGSGYPRGVSGAQISPMGQVLLLAEVVAAFFEKYTDRPAQRLSLMLRLSHRKFPAAFTQLVLPLLDDDGASEVDPKPLLNDAERQGQKLAQIITLWAELRAGLPEDWLSLPSGRACAFVDMRLSLLQKTLNEAGAHPNQQAEILPMLKDDAQGLAEIVFVGREALWELESIANACQRRWPQAAARADAVDASIAQWCEAVHGLSGG
jgi:HD-GYP domain-containing protein (c-di-GMP phosphodiesterase class II)